MRPFTVLIADDSPDDRFTLRRVIGRLPQFKLIGEVEDGTEVIAYLEGTAAFMDRKKYPMPHLLLLDLKMPRFDGFDVLKWLRSKPMRDLTVVVLSGSSLATDVEASLALGAHGYWTKTSDARKHNLIAEEIATLLDKRHASQFSQTFA